MSVLTKNTYHSETYHRETFALNKYFKKELGSTKTYIQTAADKMSVRDDPRIQFAVNIKVNQDKHPTLYWLSKLHKMPYKAGFIASSSSCTTTGLTKLIASYLTTIIIV